MRETEEHGRCVALNLSTEVIRRVFCQLDCIDLIHCSLVSRQWHADSAELREAWKAEYMDACIDRGFRILRENNPLARVEAYIS
ncbi:hypothetical protein SUGI_0661110, partial [Cryptomeria japonica]